MVVDGYSPDLVNWNSAQWWSRQFNPYVGCSQISPACQNCYAKAMVERFKMNGESGFLPTKHNKAKMPKSGIVFVGNMTDAFGDWVGILDIIDWFRSMYAPEDVKILSNPRSYKVVPNRASYIWLTKRVGNMKKALQFAIADHPNAFFGFTAENQEWYDKRLNELMMWKTAGGLFGPEGFRYPYETPYKHWVSCEPLLGPIDLHLDSVVYYNYLERKLSNVIRQVIVGCESGRKRRECNIKWVENIVEQCRIANVPVFVKQIVLPTGEFTSDISKFPKNLQIRQLIWAK